MGDRIMPVAYITELLQGRGNYPSQMNGKDWKVSGLCRGGKRKWHKSREISQTYSNRDEHRKPYQGNEICTKLTIYYFQKEPSEF